MKIVVHGINHKEKFTKDGTKFLSCGLKYRGKWYNGTGSKITQSWDVGMEVDVDLWDEEGKDGKMYGRFVVLISQKKVRPEEIQEEKMVQEESSAQEEEPEEAKTSGDPALDDLPF